MQDVGTTKGLVRYQQCGCLPFLTFSCYHRLPYLGTEPSRSLFERSFEAMRVRYSFVVCGYVVMPEHVHLLVSEPTNANLATAIQALKLSVSVQSRERPFWQPRYYDFNVHNEEKRVEKLRTIHRNPVKRELVQQPEQSPWSSYRHYATGEIGTVEIESFWTGARRDGLIDPRFSQSRPGAPSLFSHCTNIAARGYSHPMQQPGAEIEDRDDEIGFDGQRPQCLKHGEWHAPAITQLRAGSPVEHGVDRQIARGQKPVQRQGPTGPLERHKKYGKAEKRQDAEQGRPYCVLIKIGPGARVGAVA
jgi:putative transposase